MPTVLVGDPGNAADSTGYGSVNYQYRIGQYEVSLSEYTAFLNAVAATDSYSLYNTNMGSRQNIAGITRSGSTGSYTYSVIGSGNRPVTFVSWFDAARFANWMANGQPTGAQGNATTENGAYSLFGATSGVGFTKNAINPNTLATTAWWIPSENEWYKAAYYDPSPSGPSDGYWLYATRSDSAPGNTIGAGTSQANYRFGGTVYSVTQNSTYSSTQNYLTGGGAFSNSGSFYGTYDQGGNVWEWNDAVSGSSRGLRGGSWGSNSTILQSSFRDVKSPSSEDDGRGFRLASAADTSGVPEPGQIAASGVLLIGGGLYWLVRRRKVKVAA
jgi:formylglycine-generating enzyme required for sulfatase activity